MSVGQSSNKQVYNYTGLSSDTKPTSPQPGDTFYASDTKVAYIYSSGGWVTYEASTKLTSDSTWAYGTFPEYSSLPVAISQNASATVIIPSIQAYHRATLVITLGTGDTLAINARMADGSTVGPLLAYGPAGTLVVLNTTQLVPANNGIYLLMRFDAADITFVYTKSSGPLAIQGYMAAA